VSSKKLETFILELGTSSLKLETSRKKLEVPRPELRTPSLNLGTLRKKLEATPLDRPPPS